MTFIPTKGPFYINAIGPTGIAPNLMEGGIPLQVPPPIHQIGGMLFMAGNLPPQAADFCYLSELAKIVFWGVKPRKVRTKLFPGHRNFPHFNLSYRFPRPPYIKLEGSCSWRTTCHLSTRQRIFCYLSELAKIVFWGLKPQKVRTKLFQGRRNFLHFTLLYRFLRNSRNFVRTDS